MPWYIALITLLLGKAWALYTLAPVRALYPRSVNPYVSCKIPSRWLSSNQVSRGSATVELYSALPTSILSLALTNEAAASSAIASQFATGIPTWFATLPTDVQDYFLSQDTLAASTTPSVVTLTTTDTSGLVTVLVTSTRTASPVSSAIIITMTSTVVSNTMTTDASSSPSPAQHSSGSSPGVSAGIGVGTVVGTIGIVAGLAAFCLYRRRRRQARSQEITTTDKKETDCRHADHCMACGTTIYELPAEHNQTTNPQPDCRHSIGPPIRPSGTTINIDTPSGESRI